MPCNSLTNFEYEEAFAIPELTNFAVVLVKRYPSLIKKIQVEKFYNDLFTFLSLLANN